MIGNAHIDPVWLWQWPEGYQEVRATFQSAIDRMEEYPDFVFTCDSALFFHWVEESDPARLAKLLRPCDPDAIEGYPVSTLVNSARNDSAECVRPAGGTLRLVAPPA